MLCINQNKKINFPLEVEENPITPHLDCLYFWFSSMFIRSIETLQDLFTGQLKIAQLQQICGWSNETLFEKILSFLEVMDGFRPFDIFLYPECHTGWINKLEKGFLVSHLAKVYQEQQVKSILNQREDDDECELKGPLMIEYDLKLRILSIGKIANCAIVDFDSSNEQNADEEKTTKVEEFLLAHLSISSHDYSETDMSYYQPDFGQMNIDIQDFTLFCQSSKDYLTRSIRFKHYSLSWNILLCWEHNYLNKQRRFSISLPLILENLKELNRYEKKFSFQVWEIFTQSLTQREEEIPRYLPSFSFIQVLPLLELYLKARLRMMVPLSVWNNSTTDVHNIIIDEDRKLSILIPQTGWPYLHGIDAKYLISPFSKFDSLLFRKKMFPSIETIVQQAKEIFSDSYSLNNIVESEEIMESNVSVQFGDLIFTFSDNGIHFTSITFDSKTGETTFSSSPSGKNKDNNLNLKFHPSGKIDVKQCPKFRFTSEGELIVYKGGYVADDKGRNPQDVDKERFEQEKKNVDETLPKNKQTLFPCIITLAIRINQDLMMANSNIVANSTQQMKFRCNSARVLSIHQLKLCKCAIPSCDRCGILRAKDHKEAPEKFCSFHWKSGFNKQQQQQHYDSSDDEEEEKHLPKKMSMPSSQNEIELSIIGKPTTTQEEKKNLEKEMEEVYEQRVVLEILEGSQEVQVARPPLYTGHFGCRYTVGQVMHEFDFHFQEISNCHLPGFYFFMNIEEIFDFVFSNLELVRQKIPPEVNANNQQTLNCEARQWLRSLSPSNQNDKDKPSVCRIS